MVSWPSTAPTINIAFSQSIVVETVGLPSPLSLVVTIPKGENKPFNIGVLYGMAPLITLITPVPGAPQGGGEEGTTHTPASGQVHYCPHL